MNLTSQAQPHPSAFSVLLVGGTFEGAIFRALKACWVMGRLAGVTLPVTLAHRSHLETCVLHTFPTSKADGSCQAHSVSGLDSGIILRWERSSMVISAPGSHVKQEIQSGTKRSTEEVIKIPVTLQ